MESCVQVRVGTVGLCDGEARKWVAAATGVELVPPAPGDTTFHLFGDASAAGGGSGGAEVSLTRAEELLLLHCSIGALSRRSVYMLFTLWRIADVEDVHPQHPFTHINPEVTSPGRVFSALAAGVRGASHTALRWSPNPLVDLVRCMTSQVWERRPVDEVDGEDAACRDAIAAQPWAELLVSVLVAMVLNSSARPADAELSVGAGGGPAAGEVPERVPVDEQHEQRIALAAASGAEAPAEPEPAGEGGDEEGGLQVDVHELEQKQIVLDVARRRKERAEALRKVMEAAEAAERADLRLLKGAGVHGDATRGGWDGGAIEHASYQALYALRWLMRHEGLGRLVVDHADAPRLSHFLAHRALRPQQFGQAGCECGRGRFKEDDDPTCTFHPAAPEAEAEAKEMAADAAPAASLHASPYWEDADISPTFEKHCRFCGLGASQRLDDVFSVLSLFIQLERGSSELRGSLLDKLLERAGMLIDSTKYMQDVSDTDYDEWQFGMFAALLPRTLDRGWVYASHGSEEASFLIRVALAGIEGSSEKSVALITNKLSGVEEAISAQDTSALAVLISLCNTLGDRPTAAADGLRTHVLKPIVMTLIEAMQPFVDLVDVNWSTRWFDRGTSLLNVFEKGFFWAQVSSRLSLMIFY